MKEIKKKDFILVSGANGFTGRFVCKELIKRRIKFIALLRPGNNPNWMIKNRISFRFADLSNTNELKIALRNCDCLLNIASIGFGSINSILEACEKADIDRGVFISTTAIFTNLNAKSKKIRIDAEEAIKKSPIKWTILRPTMIYGTPQDRNMIKLISWIKKYPVLPIFGDGKSLQQPIYVKDVAWAAVEVVKNKNTFSKTFNLSGKYAISYNKVISLIEGYLNKKILRLYLPAIIIHIILKLLEKFAFKLPIKSEQIKRLNEDKEFKHELAKKSFKFNPIDFKEGIKNEIDLYSKN